jgi:hypothetical protein
MEEFPAKGKLFGALSADAAHSIALRQTTLLTVAVGARPSSPLQLQIKTVI